MVFEGVRERRVEEGTKERSLLRAGPPHHSPPRSNRLSEERMQCFRLVKARADLQEVNEGWKGPRKCTWTRWPLFIHVTTFTDRCKEGACVCVRASAPLIVSHVEEKVRGEY